MKSLTLAFAVACILTAIPIQSCKYPNTPMAANSFPETRLSNIPPNDTIAQYIRLGVIPEIVLYWNGSDPDGYLIGYKYRWIDISGGRRVENPHSTIMNIVSLGPQTLDQMIMVKGTPRSLPEMYRFFSTLALTDTPLIRVMIDSLATGRSFAVPYKSGIVPGDSVFGADTTNHRSPTRGKFIFDSPADRNMHRFEISSIDNNGSVDPSPAVVNFWTLRSPTPFMRINAPSVTPPSSVGLIDTTQVAIRYATNRFRGLQVDFSALDQSTFDIVYSWSVDDTVRPESWSSWSTSTSAFITASSFRPVRSGWHRFYVRARNRWGVLSNIATYNHPRSPNGESFKAIVPDIDSVGFPRRILVYNSTPPGDGTLGQPTSQQLAAFYGEILDSAGKSGLYDFFVPTVSNRFPSQEQWGRYSTTVFVIDRRTQFPGVFQLNTDAQNLLRKYLQVGGNLIFSGPADTTMILGYSGFAGEFFHSPPFGYPTGRRNGDRDFVGAKGQLGYPNLRIDPAKLPPDSLGALRNISINIPSGFAQIIGTFDSRSNNPNFEDQPMASRFLAPDPTPPARREYSVIHFGFPMYFAERSAAIQAMRKALTDVKEQ
jgi:hypothetical protein